MATYMTDDLVTRWSTFTTDDNLNPDSFIVFQDVDKAHSDMIDRYYVLKNKTFTTDAEKAEMTQLAVNLQEYLPTSDTWNKLCACIRGMQMYMRDGIVVFVEQKQAEINQIISNYSEKGDWNSTTTYSTGNFVRHGEFLFLSKVDNNLNHEPNNEVSTDTYWLRFMIKGEKGDPSLNISIKKGTDNTGNFDNTITYNTGDACVYNHRLYYCIVDGTVGINPTDTARWKCGEKIWVGTDTPLDTSIIWWDTNVGENVFKRYSDNNTWVRQNVKASDVTLVDIGNMYTSTNVEDALTEVMTKVNTIDLTASKVNVVDSGNLYNGTNAEACFAEVMNKANSAFTLANSGKTSIANTVGTVTSSNTFGEINNEIQTDKNILASNLVNKGVSANSNNSLRNLVSLVANITLQSMGGMQVKTGTLNANTWSSGITFKQVQNNRILPVPSDYLLLQGLDFTPNTIIIYNNTSITYVPILGCYSSQTSSNQYFLSALGHYTRDTDKQETLIYILDNTNIFYGGFKIPIEGSINDWSYIVIGN
jgi:hypothetical protein